MSASDDTTDAVVEARQFISEMDAEGYSTLPSADIMQELLARIDDLEAQLAATEKAHFKTKVCVWELHAKLAAVTRERDEARLDEREVRDTLLALDDEMKERDRTRLILPTENEVDP